MLVEATGVPIALEVGPAQRPDVKLLAATLKAVVVEPPDPTEQQQHMGLDKAYAGEPAQQLAEEKGYEVHVPDKANAKKKRKRKGGRRKRLTTCQCFTLRALSSVGESDRDIVSITTPVYTPKEDCQRI
jgi:hypothetical protein